jgi:hypothetical protein
VRWALKVVLWGIAACLIAPVVLVAWIVFVKCGLELLDRLRKALADVPRA